MAEVGYAYVSILPSTRGFGARLIGSTRGEVDGAGKKLGGGFGKVFAAAAAVGIGAAVGGYLKGAIDQASDLNESTTKIDAIFGKAASTVQEFASGGAKALGQTKLEVLDAAANFGTFGKAAGLAGGDLAKFSTGFAGLSTDLASFYNTSPEEAVEAIGAALRGESEPIRKYGVLLDDATLRAEALKLGLVSTTKEALTPQQKVLAAQSAIYKQTADAQGDFERTSGGLANQQRILSASLSDIKTELGTALLPTATRFFTFLNDKGVPALIAGGSAIKSTLGPAFDRIGDFFSGEGGNGIRTFASAFQANLLPALQAAGVTFQTQVLPALTAFGSYLRDQLAPVFAQVAGIVVTNVLPILSSLATFVYGQLYPAILNIVSAVAVALKPAFEALIGYVQTTVLPIVNQLLTKFRQYQPTIQAIVLKVVQVAGAVLKFAAVIIGKVVPVLVKFQTILVSGAVSAIGTLISASVRVVGALVSFGKGVADVVKKVIDFAKTVRQKVGEAVDVITGLPGKALGAVSTFGTLLYDAGARLIQGLINGITSKIGAVKDKVGEVAGSIRSFFPGSPVKEGPLRSWNRGGAGRRLAGMLAAGLDAGASDVAQASARLAGQVATPSVSPVAGLASGSKARGDGSVVTELRKIRAEVARQGGSFGAVLNGASASSYRRGIA